MKIIPAAIPAASIIPITASLLSLKRFTMNSNKNDDMIPDKKAPAYMLNPK